MQMGILIYRRKYATFPSYHGILSHPLSPFSTLPPTTFLIIHGSPQQAGVSLITFWELFT